MDKELAKETLLLGIAVGGMLDSQLKKIQQECDAEEFSLYAKRFAQVMGYLLTEIKMPIFNDHPELKPEYLDGGTLKVKGNKYDMSLSEANGAKFSVTNDD